jgi:hypothetical protein
MLTDVGHGRILLVSDGCAECIAVHGIHRARTGDVRRRAPTVQKAMRPEPAVRYWSLLLGRMAPQRSYAHSEVGQQLYAVLESIKKPEALWDKLATGNYDWLGVRRNGRYVIGRPRLSPVPPHDDTVPDDQKDLHRIEFLGPLQRRPRWEAFATAGDAREAFHRVVAGDPVTPLQNSGVWKVRLVLDGEPVEDLLVVRALPRLI